MNQRFRGVVTPLLTPYNNDHSINHELYARHARACLEQGAHYLSPFGTTGEALSNAMRERMAVIEMLIDSGTARPAQLMPGTGLCNLEETAQLTRHAVDLGCAAAMVLPPFFYPNISDEGLYRYYSELIHAVASDALRLCLYHIPQMTGVPLSPGLAARLNQAYPDIVVAYKDSSGNWDNTEAVIRAAPGISVFPGSESFMLRAMQIGGGGCISASCNSNVVMIRRLFDQIDAGNLDAAEAMQGAINVHRQAIQDGGLIPALKSLKAHQSGEARWLNLRPPLLPADPTIGSKLAATLQS